MSARVVEEAAQILLASQTLLTVVVGSIAATQLATSIARRRALHPRLPLGHAVRIGAADEVASALLPLSASFAERWHPVRRAADSSAWLSRTRLSVLGAQIAAVALGLGGTVAFETTGHAPWPAVIVAVAVLTGAVAALAARRSGISIADRSLLARRSVHLAVSTVATEAAAAGAAVASVLVVVDTAGVAAVSVVEAAAIATTVRLVSRLSPLPAGLVVAEVVWIVPLLWIGVPLPTAIAAAIVWRLGMAASLTAAGVLSWRVPEPAGELPADSAWGRYFHRAAFRAIGWLPESASRRVRRRIFDSMFSVSSDPWNYADAVYEQRKRTHLIGALPPEALTILEFGCADGHNLAAIAQQRPGAMLIGTDVSASALEAARVRVASVSDVLLVHTDQGNYEDLLRDRARTVDVVILAEVLYYLGGGRSLERALDPIGDLLAPGGTVIMLHGLGDAEKLHAAALGRLRLGAARSWTVTDPHRPFVLTTARRLQ